MDAWLRSISSVTMAGSASMGADAPRAGGPAWTRVRERRDKVAVAEDGLQRVPGQRIGPPHHLHEAGAARGRGQPPGGVDEQPPAGLVHRRHGRQLPH